MHVLVLAVLVRAGGFDELGGDAEPDEPDRERGEAAEGVGGEGRSVVGPDPLRETVLAEEPLEDLLGGHQGGAGEPTAAEEVAGEHVLSGEGVAEHAVAQAELAVVVDGPDGVGLFGQGPGAAGMPATDAWAAWLNETLPVDDVVDGGPGGKRELGPVVFEEPPDLLGPVVGVGFANLEDRLSDVWRCGPGAALWRSATVLEPGAAILLEAIEPLVAGSCG
jgi:hypothetical protein